MCKKYNLNISALVGFIVWNKIHCVLLGFFFQIYSLLYYCPLVHESLRSSSINHSLNVVCDCQIGKSFPTQSVYVRRVWLVFALLLITNRLERWQQQSAGSGTYASAAVSAFAEKKCLCVKAAIIRERRFSRKFFSSSCLSCLSEVVISMCPSTPIM